MNDPVLMPACATDGPTAASNFDPGTEMNSDPGNQSEQFDVSAFRAMLEQKSEKTSEKVVVNLDDYYRQQRDKKRQDLKKKSEAATYMRSYHARKTGKSAESLNEQFDFSDFRAMLEQKSEKTSEKIVVNLDDHYRQQRDKKRQDLKNKSEAETYRRSYHARKISKSAESLNELDDDSNVDCKSSVSLSIGKRDETDILADERYGGVQPANPNLEEQSNTKHETNALNDEENEGTAGEIREPMTDAEKESLVDNECNSEKVHVVINLEQPADPNLEEQSNTKQDNNRLNDDEEQKGAVVGIEEPMTEVEKESPNENECSSEKAVVHLEHTADPNLEEQSNTKQDANALKDEEQKGTVVGTEEPMTEVEMESPDKYECNYLRSHHKAGSANAEPSNELDACDVYDKSSEGDTIGERCETSIAVGERGIEVHPVDTILSEQKIEHDANGVNGEDHEVIGAGDSNNQDSKAIEEPTNETEKRSLVENEYNTALLPRQKNAKQRKEVPSVITYVSEEVDITKIPKWKHVLVPPEREYMKVFSSCWCGN